jgi:hypothetical protein
VVYIELFAIFLKFFRAQGMNRKTAGIQGRKRAWHSRCGHTLYIKGNDGRETGSHAFFMAAGQRVFLSLWDSAIFILT